MNNCSISIIVPFKNEELFINRCLRALSNEMQQNSSIDEIILVDNCSTDKSRSITEKYDVKVYGCEGNISSVRNHGAHMAKGTYFCFVDADVEVKRGWRDSIIRFIESTKDSQKCVFGNAYGIPVKHTWVEAVWYESLANRGNVNYINGGNLIIHRSLFMDLSGFSDGLITGEDVDLCRRAARLGATVSPEASIKTIHHGYPKTIREFYSREKWHGCGSGKRDGLFSKSKIFAYFTLMSPVIIFCLFAFLQKTAAAAVFALAGVGIWLSCCFRIKSYFSLKPLQLGVLFSVYGAARAHSILDVTVNKFIKNRSYGRKKNAPLI